jgi:hypothetical protein
MNDDWRLQVDFHEEEHVRSLLEHLDARELEHDLSEAFHDRVIVSRHGNRVFLYAGTREQAESAGKLIDQLATEHGWNVDAELTHWHPTAEEWENPDVPLPDGDAARQAEHAALIAAERRETEERGYPEFEVRVDLPSRHDAVHFEEQLRGEGLPAVRRGKYLLVGATDEDQAKALAERIEAEAPADSDVKAEGTWKAAYAERPPSPFAIFGGLGG